ncbi:glycosyltransferase family 4 protein [Mesorhizobium salmacidum]|uniref:Glycosyltransferase family 4 protein n=1 Tax=Mesorhizobium salmacidum TaxID=3015171 RepID=A0ABU8L2X0_9HYPH
MRVAQVAPLTESVPPKLYGGTERIVSYLAEELVHRGHEVTLFASGDSHTSARLVKCCDRALRLDPTVLDPIPHHIVMLDRVRRVADEFDVIHFHTDLLQFPLLNTLQTPALTTLHGRLDLPDLHPFYQSFPDVPLVSISEEQRRPMPPVNWAGTVYNGLPRDLLPMTVHPSGDYLAFLGRISPEKGPETAIEIATRAGMTLKIAAKIDKQDRLFWENVISPMIATHPNVEFLGEIDEHHKADFLGNARALLFPINWPEPFGLVMIEAMACGTPVIAFDRGAVFEVIDHGVSGFVVRTVDEGIEAIRSAGNLDRRRIRAVFEERFSAERMAFDYVSIYDRLVALSSGAAMARARGAQVSAEVRGLSDAIREC